MHVAVCVSHLHLVYFVCVVVGQKLGVYVYVYVVAFVGCTAVHGGAGVEVQLASISLPLVAVSRNYNVAPPTPIICWKLAMATPFVKEPRRS